ncbi:MAG: aquaporin [Oscillospiraceae bacterium]|nr:aquaporin [Oscillospiraceae bacterium]MBR7010935.1 aquaporin [Oscillospiraceae bacterium]
MRKYAAEFIGTFVLVLVACGTAIVTGCGTAEGGIAAYFATAAAFGLVIVAMAYSIGNISGCHINPAVSIAMLVSKKMNAKDFVCYVIAQVLGAIAGAAVLGVIFGFDCGFGANAVDPAKLGGGFLVEVLLTCIFVLAILGVTSRESFSKVAGLVIGGALTLVHLLGIGITGTSVNPARSLGPAIFAGGQALEQIWIFILAPLVGGILAALIWMFLDKKDPEPRKTARKK